MRRAAFRKLACFLTFIGWSTMGLATSYNKVTSHKLFNGDTLTEYKLKNGFRVILVPRHQAKVLTYQVWFDVGSLNEKMDPKLNKTGLAHLFEHMMFRGSEKYPDGVFDQITSRLGAEKQNATTYFYRTNYYESVPSDKLERIVELEADRMEHLKLDADLLEKEKGAVVGELRRANDSPGRLGWDELMRTAYQKVPFRYTVLGSEEEIKGFTLEEAQYFYKTFYAPNNATLIVVGDTTEKDLLPLVEKYYGHMKPQQIPALNLPEEPMQTAERRVRASHKQATSELLLVGYHIPTVEHGDAVPLSLLGTHLSRGREARLRKVLVDKGIAVSAFGGASARPDLFEFVVALAEGHTADEALKIVDKEVRSLQTTLLTKGDMERSINQERLKLYSEIGDNSELANFLGETLMICGNYMRGFEILEAFDNIKAKSIQAVAKTYLQTKNRSVIVISPEKAPAAIAKTPKKKTK
ncbi:insulinase family protein [bacterium]|nr:insulinase family protein [bacterium]